jgi:hypothetical protein
MDYKDVMRECQQNISRTDLRPVFANEVFVATPIKTKKDKAGKLHREGYAELIFIDIVTRRPVSRIVLLPNLAKDLCRILEGKMKEFDKLIKNTKPDKSIEEEKPLPENYIG